MPSRRFPTGERLVIEAPEAPAGRFEIVLAFDRFRTLRIRVRPDGEVVVRAPRHVPLATVLEHVRERAGWIAGHLRRVLSLPVPTPPSYGDGAPLRHLGRELRLRYELGRAGPPRMEGECLVLPFSRPPEAERVRRVVESWRLAQAREIFTRMLRALLPRFDALGVRRPTELKVRAMTSRWGSCTAGGVVTLNRHLLKARPELIEYVIAHELCHLRHMSHDKRFYGLLSQALPQWKTLRAELRREPIH